MKLFSVLLLLLISCRFFAQEILCEYKTRMKSYDSYPVVNSQDSSIALFLVEKDSVRLLTFDKTFKMTGEFLIKRSEENFNNLLGVGYFNGIYQVFFSDDSKTKFYAITIDLISKKVSWAKFPFILEDATFLEAITYKNHFHIFAVKRKSSILKVYRFNEKTEFEEYTVDCSAHRFASEGFSRLSDVLRTSESFLTLTSNSFEIDNNCPSTIELASKENKIYTRDNKFIITMDNEHENTKILSIDVNDFTYTVSVIEKGKIDCRYSNILKSNSFLFRNLFLQAKVCEDELLIQVRKYPDFSLLNEFRTKKNEDLNYNNTPMIQDAKVSYFALKTEGKEKNLKSTGVLFRKYLSGNFGITAFQSPLGYELMIGSYNVEQPYGSNANTVSYPVSTVSSPITPAMTSYKSYTETISTYFKTLIDSTGTQHLDGPLSENGFDKIFDFSKEIKNDILSETIFTVDDYYVYGYYLKKNKTFYLRKFSD